TYSPRSSLNALREYGYFSVSAAVRNDVAAATLTEIFYEMDRMRSLAVTDEELESARNYLTGVFSLGVATQDGLLSQLSVVYLDRLPEDYLETYRRKIHALSADDVLAAARRHFDSANAQIVMVGDRARIGEQAALFGAVTAFDAQGNEIR
ncbi:MAG: insulinase family protein, partial [Acidobacteriota bacterium]|nr:insulinase family protein [Acidobacteriota bacterium]